MRSIAAKALLGVVTLWVFIGSALSQTLLRDVEIEEFLRDYAEPLMETAGVDTNGIEILLVGDNDFNAFAGPGVIGMNTGTILMSETPNEIQGVLAHEVGHLAGAHAIRGPEAYAKAARPAMLSMVLAAAAIAAGAPPEAGLTIAGVGQNYAIGQYLSYSRGQESAADQAGLSYLEHVGASGAGLIESFERLAHDRMLSEKRASPYLQTHPVGLQRISALSTRAEAQPHYEVQDSEAEIFRLRMIQAKIRGFMSDPFATLRRYPLSDQSPPAHYARAVAYYRASRLDDAEKEIDRLIEGDPDNPFFAELKGQMLFEHGKIRQAIPPHRRSVELGPQYALFKINLARALIATESDEEVTEGIGLLRTALITEPDNSFAWSELARAQALKGNQSLAALAQAEAMYYVGDAAQAHRFASIARDNLEEGTPEHLRAVDIVMASEEGALRARNRGGQRRR